jgi:hypothetical protein
MMRKDDEENRTRAATMMLVGVRRIQVAGHESMLFFFFSPRSGVESAKRTRRSITNR